MIKKLAMLVAVVAVPWVTGCATVRSDYAVATGEPMRLHDQTVTEHGTESVATGQDQYTNQQGDVVATKTHYENRDVSWEEREYWIEQGGTPIDDESFFRIVKDEEATRRYDEHRAAGVTRNRVGIVATVVGALVFAGGTTAFMTGRNDDSKEGKQLFMGGAIGMAAGSVIAGLGVLAYMSGRKDAEDPNLRLFDATRLKNEARRYDTTTLGLIPRVTGSANAVAAVPSPPAAKNESDKAAIAAPVAAAAVTRVTVTTHSRTIEAAPDGFVFADKRCVGRMDEEEITDTKGKVVVRVSHDGTISATNSKSGSSSTIGRFDGDDIVLLGRGRVSIESDGAIVLRRIATNKKPASTDTLGRTDATDKMDKKRALSLLFATAFLSPAKKSAHSKSK